MNSETDIWSTPELRQLLEQYRSYLAAKASVLAESSDIAATGDAEALEHIRSIAHSLCGSGETYGYPTISTPARELEHASNADVKARVDDLVAAIRAVLATDAAAR